MTSAKPRPNRGPSAAAENRAAILAAARIHFAGGGLSAPLSAIARDAGVGQGSLYRHFPDRLALAVAVFDENLDALERHVAGGAAGIAALLDLVEQQAVVSPGLIDLMWQHLDDERVAHLGSRVAEIAEAAIAHDRAAGIVLDGVDARDVLAAIAMLADLTARSSQLGDNLEHPGRAELVAQADRAQALVRRGLGIDR